MRAQSHRLVNWSSADTARNAGGRFENRLIHLKDSQVRLKAKRSC